MKLPKILDGYKEKPNQNDVVAVFMGRGCISGIVVTPSKRKSKVRCVDGKEEWFENKKLRVINDERWKNEVIREISKSFPEA